MKNIYVIVSDDKITIETNINKIKTNYPNNEVVSYNLTEVPIEELIEDLDTYNFLYSNKIIIGLDAESILHTKKSEVNHNLNLLEKYINNPSPDNILILVTSAIDKRKKLNNLIISNSQVIEEKVDIKKIIKNNLEDYQMNPKTIQFLINYCNNDNEKIINELEKLKMYCLDKKIITEEAIEKIVSKNIDDNIFTLIDDILNNKKEDAFLLYKNLILHGEQVTSIITKLANKIRLIYQTKIFLKDGKGDQEISKLLSVHPYPVKLAREISYNYSENLLLEYLTKLANLDYDLKSGHGVPEVIFETFIASI